MKLSKHFTLDEFVRSQTAARLGIDNTPGDVEIENGIALCEHVLEPLREYIQQIMHVSSFYRCPELNVKIGGSQNSQHCKGQAVDVSVYGLTPGYLIRLAVALDIDFDQAIDEFGRWAHFSFVTDRTNRRETLEAYRDSGKTHYREMV